MMTKMNIEEINRRLSDKVVGIAGCGGLGSNCAMSLARCGIGKIIIADFDTIDQSNLNRQYFFLEQLGMKKVMALTENIKKVAPSCIVEPHDIKLSPVNILKLFRDCNVIIEAFDKSSEKAMIIETVLAEYPEIPIISGLGLAGYGNTNDISVEKHGKLYICGDRESEVDDDHPPLAPRVNIVANMQANVALELLLKLE